MDFSKTEKIAQLISKSLNIEVGVDLDQLQPQISVASKDIFEICKFLAENPELYFDFLNCISAIDNGLEVGTIDLIYHISSIPFGNSVALKSSINRDLNLDLSVCSVSSIWKSADWHEREIFDFYGLKFSNHPDLRRILLPADWQGHPMRKDYEEQAAYHGIKVKY